MYKNICIIGAGNIGSRHLQALAKVSQPLFVQVIDPSPDSLSLAKTRYEEIKPANPKHKLTFSQSVKDVIAHIDIAIIATTSNIRSMMTKQLLDKTSVKYIIFEKILFDKFNQYKEMTNLISTKKAKAWVNCSRRTMPFYRGLKEEVKGQKIHYIVSGSQWGLACNAIHLVDHIAYLTNCYDFQVDTTKLTSILIESKRKGFSELTGTLSINFENGSFASFTCYPTSNTPQIMQILSENFRCLTLETENKSYISSHKSKWQWELKTTPMLYQSEMTNHLVSSLLKSGSCELTPYNLSSKLHLQLFEPLLKFVNQHSEKKYENYPFT